MKKILLPIVFLFASACIAQQINPTTQIVWPRVTGAGTPTAVGIVCDAAHYGMPYQNQAVNPNTNYTCANQAGTPTWQLVNGSGSSGGSYFPGTPTVTPSGTPTAGQVLTATSGSAANWQNASAPPQTQYAVPAYLLSPSGGLASLGASHLSVDPTGYNLSGYHANLTNLGVSASQADCTQVGGLFGGHSCVGLTAYYPGDAGSIEWGHVINFSAWGPGQNLGNDGTPNSRITTPFSIYDNIRNRGGNAANFISMFGSRVGDWGPWYAYDFSDGGVQAPSDEGLTVAGTYQGGESFGYFHGTVLTGGAGATTPTFNFTGGCGGLNLCNPTDGGILLDTQAAVASGYLTGPSVDVSTGAVPLKALPVSTTLPTTTAWGHAEGLSIPATADRNITAPETIALTMVTGSFSPGDHVCVEGVGLPYGGFDEQSIVTSVGGGSITLPLAYPYSAVAIFKGGPCGTYISFAANLALSGYRTSYHAIASFTGSDLIYAVPSAGGLNGMIGAGLPIAGSEPETTNGSSDPSSAFQTFCGAEIIESLSSGNSPVQIDPNGCAWTVADTVESPHFPSQKVYGLFMQANQNMPNLSNEGTGGINIGMSGMGVAGYTQGYQVNNLNSNAWYSSGGGKLAPPECAFCATGTWNDDLLTTAPADSILRVNAHLPGQTSYNLFEDGTGSGFGGVIRLDASGFSFDNNLNATGAFNGPGANLTTQLSVINGAGSAILHLPATAGPAFSIDVTAANAPANSPQVALNSVGGGSGPSGGIDFYYNLHDSSANLIGGLIPYGDSAGPSLPGLTLDVNTRTDGLTHMIWASPGTYSLSEGLTLMNGTTDCATLICLGPDATVDSSGNTVVNNLTINGTCTGCGSGTFSALSGDATSTSTGGATTVQGLKNVPFCTGFTPTTGQALIYTTASLPNPCYTAATPSGSGTVTHTGALTANHVMLGNGSADSKVDTGCASDGAGNSTCASYTATGVNPMGGTAGLTGLGAGTFGSGSIPAGISQVAPTSIPTAYAEVLPSAAPIAGQVREVTAVNSVTGGDQVVEGWATVPTVGTWGALNYPSWSSGTPFVKMTAAGTFGLDTNTYANCTAGTSGSDCLQLSSGTVPQGNMLSQYKTWTAQDGVVSNVALPTSGFPAVVFGFNQTSVTETITATVRCFVDGGTGTTFTLVDNSANNLLGATGTCSTSGSTIALGSTTTLSAGGYMKYTLTPDGTAKTVTITVGGVY